MFFSTVFFPEFNHPKAIFCPYCVVKMISAVKEKHNPGGQVL